MPGRSEGHQREFFRLRLEYALCADMTIVLVKGKTMEIGSTQVLIEDIGAGGLRFLSHLKMPANDQLVLQFATELCGQALKMYGHVVRTIPWETDYYEYAVRFTMEEEQHLEINRLVNRLAIRYRQKRTATEGRFFKGDRLAFLKELAQASLAMRASEA
ncbi:PilZ domain-containing protein [Brevibacillus formosus]|uniref:Pilus assembly protein PilZ n=1 Tax=Brevibacillus formosus TaxID=54913 RepID=A0A837KMW1_9BACL|nr:MULTISPECIES: PilZ domain-containing protein [Brevibacillus]KLH98523.1 pilus assembly protein PilZ [Brevibacillus formosus]MBW5468142.1 PilZ domain-containing protein [Brevibacillus formosus]MED1945943.1 PilZ domain-containing protein [Brevibacillus formosus]MED1960407.1 PilZ domain-containing protein [Brevibacillus formosus]MED1997866.1 PilZ domain-containing protein [Brevibacillus formosus]